MLKTAPQTLHQPRNLKVWSAISESNFLWRLLKIALMTLIVIKALQLSYFGLLGKFTGLTDFNAFHLAGSLALDGHLSEAYHIDEMRAAQKKLTDAEGFMPWTYPLPFDLIASALALMPIGAAYFLFTTTSLVAFFSVLKRLVGAELFIVSFLNLPALLLNVECGQNGLLTAALVGLFCLWYLGGKKIAGIPLGLMIIKPHLIVGIGVYLVLKREWQVLGIAAIVGFVCSLLATLCFGWEMWTHFFQAIHEAGTMLKEEKYPLFRMSSAFAMVLTISHNFLWAGLSQLSSFALALAIIIIGIKKTPSPRASLGIACMTNAFFSPYIYDYDLLIAGLGMGLLLPEFHKHLTSSQQLLAALGLLFAQGGWLLLTPLILAENTAQAEATLSVVPSLGAFFILTTTMLLLRALNYREN